VVTDHTARLGVDVGGTFTDLVNLRSGGAIDVVKVPSTPDDPARGLWSAVDRLTLTGHTALIHGTTVATNALLERKGGRVVLLATEGFEDLLWLRRQDRPSLYDLARDHPEPLLARDDVVGVRERTGPDGVITPLTNDEIARLVHSVRERAPDAVAVALLFSFRHPDHEQRIAEALRRECPDVPVATSHEVLPVFREYERTSTVVAEAFLRPRVRRYLHGLMSEADRRGIETLRVMTSSGGSLRPGLVADRAASLALSGPVGGVHGAKVIGDIMGYGDLLTVDMGGTSTDASVIRSGAPVETMSGAIAGVPIALPHVMIETVGAGGGSIAWVDPGGALRVGPHSAGAVPGPACYGRGGEDATVTDAAVVAGWIDPANPLAGDLALDPAAAAAAVHRVAERARLSVERCADGILEIVTTAMARALRKVSVERGVDPRDMALVAFGGAGPLFACRLADSLGMRTAIVPPHAGVLSALGLAAAADRVEHLASVHRLAAAMDAEAVAAVFRPLEHAARAELSGASIRRFADCRYPGQGYEVTVPIDGDGPAAGATFHRVHEQRFGHADPDRDVEIVNVRAVALGTPAAVTLRAGHHGDTPGRLESMKPGAVIRGAATIAGYDTTARIEPGWTATVHETGALLVERP
jgi:N-methylhydantoinase A